MQDSYLLFIGTMNALGAVLLLAATRPSVSDVLLRRWTWIVPQDQPYPDAPGPAVWTLWAAIGTAGFAWLNFRACTWPAAMASEVVLLDVIVYGSFELAAIIGTARGRWGPGLWVTHPLWLGQAAWGGWVLLAGDHLGV